ncbi:MAG: hypothetical protein ACOCV4_00030 [Myxococcota bacterium]
MADTKKVLTIVGAGCGALLLVTCCFAAAGLWYCKSGWDATDQVAKAFLLELREGRIDDAYARMTPEYRSEHDLAAFRQDVASTPALREHENALISQRHFEPGVARLGGALATPRGTAEYRMVLEKAEDRWMVADIRVDEAPSEEKAPPGEGAPPE